MLLRVENPPGIPGIRSGALKHERIKHEETIRKTQALSTELLTEEIGNASVTTSPDGDSDVTNTLAQLGKPLSSQQVSERLRRINNNLIFEPSLADKTKVGVYVMNQKRENLTGSWRWEKQFLMGMEKGFMPEFSVRHWEPERIPNPDLKGGWEVVKKFTRETRGWRTVLMRLIRLKLVTDSQAGQAFGAVGRGDGSANWKMLTT